MILYFELPDTGLTPVADLYEHPDTSIDTDYTVTEVSPHLYAIDVGTDLDDYIGTLVRVVLRSPAGVGHIIPSNSGTQWVTNTFSTTDVNVVSINGNPVVDGIIRFNIIDSSYLRKGVLILTEEDTYSLANGNPVVFESDLFPDLTIVDEARLAIYDPKTDATLVSVFTTLLDNDDKTIKFQITQEEMSVPPGDAYMYDVELHYTIGHRTIIRNQAVINSKLGEHFGS